MLCNIISVTVLLTLFSSVFSEDAFLNETIHIRVKRGKYYSYPSRFYRRPPNSYPVKGPFSITPPPGYMDDDEPPYPGRPHDPRPKVSNSKRANDGLRDEDINNLVKYLSKQDLDKLIDMASEKERFRDNSVERRPYKRDESRVKDTEYSTPGFSLNGPYKVYKSDKFGPNGPWAQESDSIPLNFKPQDDVYNGPFKSQSTEEYSPKPQYDNTGKYNGPYAPTDLLNYVEDATQSKVVYVNHDTANLQTEESMQNKQISYLNAYIHHEINDMPRQINIQREELFPKQVDNGEREELLPKPVNLREEDFDISYTNKVPTVVRPSYKVENFGDLPLMSNAHKLETVSSYKVPHYTVTSSSKYSPPPPPASSSSYSPASVRLEPAPPISAAKEQSDAHLKAIKIWTHRSPGTAYTLHNDGTLSLERQRPKKYGP